MIHVSSIMCVFITSSRFLRSSSVEEIQAGTFARLKSLRELYLSGNRLKTLYANTFRGDKAGGLSFDVL